MKRIMCIFAALSLLAVASTAGATELFINGGFEADAYYMQDLSGWTLDNGSLGMGSAQVKPVHVTDQGNTYDPVEGSNFVVLTAGDLVVDINGDPVPGSRPTTLSQSFTVAAGLGTTTVSGWAAFDAMDYGSFADFGYVRILDANGNILATPFFDEITVNSDPYFDGPWTQWFWSTAVAGTYFLEFGVADVGDDPAFPAPWNSSMLLVDGVTASSVPEPSTLILSLAGLAAVVFVRRRCLNG